MELCLRELARRWIQALVWVVWLKGSPFAVACNDPMDQRSLREHWIFNY
jgi:hypothetical protein